MSFSLWLKHCPQHLLGIQNSHERRPWKIAGHTCVPSINIADSGSQLASVVVM